LDHSHRLAAPFSIALGTLILLALSSAVPAAATTSILADSTRIESWTLSNGLRVVSRHVPRANSIATTVCYRAGSATDPVGREGLAALLAEVDFMSAAGEVPERTRAEMAGLRPLGWSSRTTRHFAFFTEAARVAQFPGVLHQAALRMRGVTVSEDGLRAAIARVKRDLADQYAAHPDRELYYAIGDLAAGVTEDGIRRYGSGEGLKRVTSKEVQQRLASFYVPSNAVVSLIGNLDGIDLHRLIQNELGAIPAGSPPPPPADPKLRHGIHRMTQRGIAHPIGVVGILAPALGDSLHPSFYLNTMMIGSYLKARWDTPEPPLTARFQYIVLDDPELVRLYPPVGHTPGDSIAVAEELIYSLREMPPGMLDPGFYDNVRTGMDWLLGGPLPKELLPRIRVDPPSLITLSMSMATREMTGGETFWSDYRRRFAQEPLRDVDYWRAYFAKGSNRIELKLVPAR
jgi:hypothetical protein